MSTYVTVRCACGREWDHQCPAPGWQPSSADPARQVQAVHALIAHARLISPSERAVIYVADLERALGIDAPVPHKLGGNGA